MASTGYADYLTRSDGRKPASLFSQEEPQQKSYLGLNKSFDSEASASAKPTASPVEGAPATNMAIANMAAGAGGGKGAGGVAQGALVGAALGTVVPGIGTAVGAGVGALAGLLSAQAEAEETRKKRIQDVIAQQGQNEMAALQSMGNMWSRIL